MFLFSVECPDKTGTCRRIGDTWNDEECLLYRCKNGDEYEEIEQRMIFTFVLHFLHVHVGFLVHKVRFCDRVRHFPTVYSQFLLLKCATPLDLV